MHIYLLLIIVFVSTVVFYLILLFFPEKKHYKYIIPSILILFGICAWVYVWSGKGWLASAIYGTAALIVGAILSVIAVLFDLYDKKRRYH
ncbi:hypothetical protein GCM10008986_11700 [Salinibacillus aidingensis]|uniref:YesK-like protein n=1 Tax=Salinibacillus aidingensis TaxID=237684 RepID=A0ABN1B0L5_9BACI